MRIHNYSGKENGTMVIGSASELKALSDTLDKYLETSPERSSKNWPPLITEYPLGDSLHRTLSFHLETTDASMPKEKSLNEIARTIYFIFAVAGLVSLIHSIVGFIRN